MADDGDDAASLLRIAEAEARRAKILAKQKERLARVTCGSDGSPSPTKTRVPAPQEPAASTAPASSSQASPAAPTQCEPAVQRPASPPATTEQCTPVSLPLTESVAATPSSTPSRHPPRSRSQGNDLAAERSPLVDADALPMQPQATATAPFASGLSLAVRETRFFRMLFAVLFSFCVFTDRVGPELTRVPPVLTLMISQLAVMAGMWFFLNSPAGRKVRARLPPLTPPQLPARLRGLDLSRLIPGLSDVTASASAAKDVYISMWEGISVFVFTYVALSWLH